MAGEFRDIESRFRKGIVRLAKRRAIEGLGSETKSGLELRRMVGEKTSAPNASELVNKLIEDEFVIDERRAAVAADLSAELDEKFKLPGLAVVLMGSAVHGGVKTQELMGVASSNPDFDWGIVLDQMKMERDHFIIIRTQIRDFGNELLDSLSKRYDIVPSLHGCGIVNPLDQWLWNYQNEDEAKQDLINRKVFLPHDPFLSYFCPSFPKEKNERNRRFILDALYKIASYDRKKWVRLTSSFLESWRLNSEFYYGHLVDPNLRPRLRDEMLVDDVVRLSGVIKYKRMGELILATGKNELG